MTSAVEWKPGMKLVHRAQQGWGVGEVTGLSEDGRRIRCAFADPSRGSVVLSTRDPALVRHHFAAGVRLAGKRTGEVAVVDAELAPRDGFYRYRVQTPGGAKTLDERELLAPPPEAGPLAVLRGGTWDPPEAFLLRQEAVTLDLQRRGDALGALFASRVMVKPYQVAVVHRVLTARAPRFVLADEVGLGKTVEAGMVLSALAHTGLGRRLLVATPSHLMLQWLAELYRKFNLRFTLLDAERLERERQQPGPHPFIRFDRVLTSLEVLARDTETIDALCSEEGRPDLVVFDEAHHLTGPRIFEAVKRLGAASWGALFLTATPLALDPDEYFKLLQVVEPSAAQGPEDFRERLQSAAEVAALSRSVMTGAAEGAAQASRIVSRFPRDSRLASLVEAWKQQGREADRERLLEHLADGYSLSPRLLRNRRAAVGGFPNRRLSRTPVTLSPAERELLRDSREALRRGQLEGRVPSGAVAGALLRRLESSPAAAAVVLQGMGETDLSRRAAGLDDAERDSRYRALRTLLRSLPSGEKVLVFTEARETLAALAEKLERDGHPITQYHGDLSALDRDRQVARFRDPEGPAVLLSSELGGEGRNFQFCAHLVHYDLPWSPSMVEQRIGRIDRVGQTRDMFIHVLCPEGTVTARVAELFGEAIGVFEQAVGGLDPVLDGVEEQIARLAHGDRDADWEAYAEGLRGQVAEARRKIRDDFDPLLDRRSFDRVALGALVERGIERLGVGDDHQLSDEAAALEEGLQLLSRELDERIEDVTVRLATQAGIGVDTDEHVEAFEVAFSLGREMNIEALPGMAIPDEPETVLGSFWRDTAVEREEIDSFASGHPLVEALLSLARDGTKGRTTFRQFTHRERGLGFQLRFVWQLPEADDVAAGSRVPSRGAARLLPRSMLDIAVLSKTGGAPTRRDDLLELLLDPDADHQPVRADAVPLDRLAPALEAAVSPALEWAQSELASDVARAQARMEKEREQALSRLALRRSRASEAELEGLDRDEAEERAHFERVSEALAATRLELDSIGGFLLG